MDFLGKMMGVRCLWEDGFGAIAEMTFKVDFSMESTMYAFP